VGEVVEIAFVALVLFLGVRTGVSNFRVQGYSMFPSLHNHELVLVDKISYSFTSPHRGDVIVFHPPGYPQRDYIKRVIGVPGDHVDIRNGGVYLNGRRLYEPYTGSSYARNYRMSVIPYTPGDLVPPGEYFVLGDNRRNSEDSHLWGLLPRRNIIGRAILTYWPWQNIGILSDPKVGPSHPGRRSR
jgi:signal peptidase I